MSDVIGKGKVVEFNYTLRSADGEVLDSSEDQPLPYLHGANNIVPGLEREMAGKKVGDKFEVVVSAADGYGERVDDSLVIAPHDAFPEDAELSEGMALMLEDDDGASFPAWVMEITDEGVVMDKNHPLAGLELHFQIQVATIREATPDELSHGHPHGPDGHHHH